MNGNRNSIQQPYEVIETEETITRYFNPYSKEPTSCRNDEKPISHKNSPQECPERSDPKNVLRNCEFQDLYEKFNKLRTEMSELTQKFKKINLLKAQAESSCHKMKLRGNSEELENVALDNDMKDCNSRVSVESQTDRIEPKSSTLAQDIYDKNKCRIMYGDKEYPFAYYNYPKRSDATMLRKSKGLLINLIDMELQRVHSSQKTLLIEKSMPVTCSHSKQLKAECIDKITDELSVLKDLEGLYG